MVSPLIHKKLKSFFSQIEKAFPQATHQTKHKATAKKMDASTFDKIATFIDENKEKMTDGDYMAMMAGLKSLHDKKLVGATVAPPVQPQPQPARRQRHCGICRATTHDRRNCIAWSQSAPAPAPAQPAPAQPAPRPAFLYHYTNKAGFDAITRSERMIGSRGLLAGKHIYFTTLTPPEKTMEEIVVNNWGAINSLTTNPLMSRKMMWVIKLAVPPSQELKKIDIGQADIYAIEGNIIIDEVSWSGYKLNWLGGKIDTMEKLAWRDI